MIYQSLFNVESVQVGIINAREGYYTRRIYIRTESGEEVELILFADDYRALETKEEA